VSTGLPHPPRATRGAKSTPPARTRRHATVLCHRDGRRRDDALSDRALTIDVERRFAGHIRRAHATLDQSQPSRSRHCADANPITEYFAGDVDADAQHSIDDGGARILAACRSSILNKNARRGV
jgi:hypothetical protein